LTNSTCDIGPGGNASVQSNLPAATYSAVLPSVNFDNLTGSTITGTIIGSATQGGQGVMFNISFSGLPDEAMYGPFGKSIHSIYHFLCYHFLTRIEGYHIHEMPVASGNCTTSLGHLDPTNRGELHSCEVDSPETCQAGDLAGKHGNITTATFSATYTDLYLSTDPNSSYFFGNRSIVIHSNNATRLTCANFVMSTNGSSSGTNMTASGSASPSSTASAGAASSLNCWSITSYVMIVVMALVHLM
jgi:hypothetical protein